MHIWCYSRAWCHKNTIYDQIKSIFPSPSEKLSNKFCQLEFINVGDDETERSKSNVTFIHLVAHLYLRVFV